jgi:glutamine amidotransferase
MVVIVDYGMGNIGSILNMVKKVGFNAKVSSSIDDLSTATKIILPGVGAFDKGVSNLQKLDLIDVLKEKALKEKIPILGICLGMQLMTTSSEEGCLAGLDFINAKVKKFQISDDLKVPHMGWNTIEHNKQSLLFDELKTEKRFYFVHSYYVEVESNEKEAILTTTSYGGNFTSSFEKENIVGVQFHPEKSHNYGKQLFQNFLREY